MYVLKVKYEPFLFAIDFRLFSDTLNKTEIK